MRKIWTLLLTAILALFICAPPCKAADVIIIGDAQLKPVVNVVSGIKESLQATVRVYPLAEIKGRLSAVIAAEGAQAVVALGKEAIEEALHLPPAVPLIYGLVIIPPKISRANTTGIYMAAPVGEYSSLTRKYIPSIKRLSVISSSDLIRTLAVPSASIATYPVSSSYEVVTTMKKQVDSSDALLLLPNASLLTAAAMEDIYLYSFRKKIPLLGVSERQVRDGALFSLVFDPISMGRQIGERTMEALKDRDAGQIPPAPSKKFDLFINTDTARNMGIDIPNEMLKQAKRVYPQ